MLWCTRSVDNLISAKEFNIIKRTHSESIQVPKRGCILALFDPVI
jgi:hypothetical protein